MLHHTYKYSRWDGTQNMFDLDAEELMDRISDDLFNDGDLWKALREMMRRGLEDRSGQPVPGLQQLMDQLKNQRRHQLQQYNMDSVMDNLKQRLNGIVSTERDGIENHLKESRQKVEDAGGPERQEYTLLLQVLKQRADRNIQKLDALPNSAAGAIKDLMDYDFTDPEAQRMFQELLSMLRQHMARTMGHNMMQNLRQMTTDQMQGMQDMLRQLNNMLQDHIGVRQPDFRDFMDQYGHNFGPNPPQNLEKLLQMLQQQLGQMQSLLDSMSPETRRELEDTLNSVLDPDSQQEMTSLAQLIGQIMPMENIRREYPFLGDDNLTLDQAMQVMGNLQRMDEMERALQEAILTGDLDQVDHQILADTLGEEAQRTWERLQHIMQMLKDTGYIKDTYNPELTARAIRKIAQKALKEVFVRLKKDRLGGHELDLRGVAGDALADTKPYEFGDPFQIHLQKTIKNSILRAGTEVPLHLMPQDFEVYRNEHMTRTSTAVLLDQSRSMGMFGAYVAAKKVALSLFALIHSQFPRDTLHVIGFSDYARQINEEDLAKTSWNSLVSGTNLQHALMISRRLLSKDKGSTRQILLIIDGEPTSHLEGDQSYFAYPPSHRTILETMKEVRRCTQEDIVINTFMLENNYQLMNFVDQITDINGGRAFYSGPDRLGEYVLIDYVNNRRKRVRS